QFYFRTTDVTGVVHLPEGTEGALAESLAVLSRLHRWPLEFEAVPMRPGDEVRLKGKRRVRAFKTFHPVPCLGYAVVERVQKLKPEFAELPGQRIGELRRQGAEIFDDVERHLFAYATDTLPEVLRQEPWLGDVETLVLECTFLDERKSIHAARAGCHIHLDELLGYHEMLRNPHLVLMHFSQLYRPDDVRRILAQRLPMGLVERVTPFVPDGDRWWN
ncbi:MAG: MBL fold metallo-hydrolase, partial [Myxococcales bacterium]|nr:MBL fold metallo-hydrolase [Myxococcales bacterium]